MTKARARLRCLLWLAVTVAIGIASRRLRLGVPLWDKSVGDVLYAVMIALLVAFVRPSAAPRVRTAIAFGICLAIELFQITGIPIALAAKRPWVHWILGGSFAWHDVACY